MDLAEEDLEALQAALTTARLTHSKLSYILGSTSCKKIVEVPLTAAELFLIEKALFLLQEELQSAVTRTLATSKL